MWLRGEIVGYYNSLVIFLTIVTNIHNTLQSKYITVYNKSLILSLGVHKSQPVDGIWAYVITGKLTIDYYLLNRGQNLK